MDQKVTPETDDVIDAEFTVEQESGFGCAWCWKPLLIGEVQCLNCKRVFATPAPSLRKLNESRHASKLRAMALIYRGRMIMPEIDAMKISMGKSPFVQAKEAT